jgi:uncharacterized protein (TIGR00369 family)
MDIRLDLSPYQRFLGIRLVEATEGRVVIRLPFRDELLREDGSDWLHGGVVSALADIAGAYAVVSVAGEGSGATIDLRIDWLKPARKGDLVATGTLVKAGRRFCRADVEVHDGFGDLLAVGRGTFTGAAS